MLRDMERLDRQDDNAACRTFSGGMVKWTADTHSDLLGCVVYLFVAGETVDAIQNRFLPISERVVMILRTHFFMEMWLDFLEAANYPKSKYCISHEALDILHYIVRGFLQLVVIHRDHLEGKFPFLPWLHSTEACEHIFGICRQLIKDFTMLDFHYMIPKLYVRLREHSLFQKQQTSSGKATASGCNHTYTDLRRLDLAALSTYPSHDEMARTLTPLAYSQATGLWDILGVDFDSLRRRPKPFPSASTWFSTSGADAEEDVGGEEGNTDGDGASDIDEDDLVCGEEEVDPDEGVALELQRHMYYFEDEYTTSSEDKTLNGLAYAATMLSMQEVAVM